MPYPRWVKPSSVGQPTAIDWYLRSQFPGVSIRPVQHAESLDVLIAGCGTGQHAIETAQRFAGARVLAVDLSRASLAYAARKSREARPAQHRIHAGRHPQSRRAQRALRRHRIERRAAPSARSRSKAGGCWCRCCGPAASCMIGLYSALARVRHPRGAGAHRRARLSATPPPTSAAAGRSCCRSRMARRSRTSPATAISSPPANAATCCSTCRSISSRSRRSSASSTRTG